MRAAANLDVKQFALAAAGATLQTTAGSAFPIRYQKLTRYNDGAFTEFGALVKTRK